LIKVAKPFVFLLCLVPFGLLLWGAFFNPASLGANPVEFITHSTGDWILRFLVITLTLSPLRYLTGWNWLIRFRRMMGLFAFFYSVLHFAIYCISISALNVGEIFTDITKRLYVTVGFLSFVFMFLLAFTSTKGWIRRLGGKRWQMLHRLVYASAILGVLHYLWLVKLDITHPLQYGAVIGVLLLFRVGTAVRARLQPTGG
jgi:sulfoxide reductase heme-binding subunit YedZ